MSPFAPGAGRLRKAIAALLAVAALVLAVWAALALTEFEYAPEHPERTLRLALGLGLAAAAIGPARSAGEGSRRAREPIVRGASAGGAAGVAVVLAWCLVHPVTDYPPASRLVPAALFVGLAFGALLGIAVLLALVPLRRSGHEAATARLAVLLGAGGVVVTAEWLDPSHDWTWPTSLSPFAALLVGLGVFAALFLPLLALERRGRLRLPAALAALIVTGAAAHLATPPRRALSPHPEGLPRAVLLVTIDTLRADHVGCYGYERDTTPRLDELARESVLFERAFSQMGITDPSHVTILTGLHPRTTGVMRNALPIARPDTSSLAEWFRDRGYRTGAITSRVALDPGTLSLPGFDSWSVPTPEVSETTAPEAVRRARTWLDRNDDGPFFLWVHLFDPHYPYAPPEPERSRYAGDRRGEFVRRGYAGGPRRGEPYPAGEMEHGIALYDGEIHFTDRLLGELVDDVRSRVDREDLLLVVTADHGETLDELDDTYAYGFNHGKVLARQELHVPLLVSWPGHLPEGVRIETPVGLVSLAPSLTALLGSELEGDGRSLAPALQGERIEPAPVFAERELFARIRKKWPFHAVPERAVVDGRWFLAANPMRGRFLHDIEADPRGTRNRVEDEPETVARLERLLRVFTLEHPATKPRIGALPDGLRDALRGLGYAR